MKWSDAIKQVSKGAKGIAPSWTNREASGLIGFARAAYNTFGKAAAVALTPIDWYAFTLPALGWLQVGDKFKIDTAHQLSPYPASAQLAAALGQLATELDAQGVKFRVLIDPRGTDKTFRALATDAWTAMQQEAKGEGVAMPESPIAAAAAKPKKPPKLTTPMALGTPKQQARRALEEYVSNPKHKRWFLFALRKMPPGILRVDFVTKDGDDEKDVADPFGSLGLSDTPYGDLGDISYGAYWDTAQKTIKPAAEYGGQLEVIPDAAPKKNGGGGVLALLALFALGRKRRRA